jgi:hypothetical protein
MNLSRTDNISERAMPAGDLDSNLYVVLLDEVEDYLNRVEDRVNKAKWLLDDINSVRKLTKVEDALDIIKEVSEALY